MILTNNDIIEKMNTTLFTYLCRGIEDRYTLYDGYW